MWRAWVVLSLGCASQITTQQPQEPPAPTRYEVILSDQWSPESAEQLLGAVDDWREVLGPWVELQVSWGACDDRVPGCVAPVELDTGMIAPDVQRKARLREEGQQVEGATGDNGSIDLWRETPELRRAFSHELGHRFGLWHSDGGVMSQGLTRSDYTPELLAHLRRLGLR